MRHGRTGSRRRPGREVAGALALAALVCASSALARGLPGPVLHTETAGLPNAETLYDWSEARCDRHHVPDAPARAVRTADGVRVFPSYHRLRSLRGRSLDELSVECDPAWESKRQDDPSKFDDYTWIMSFHAGADGVIHALAHAEFHGHRRPGLCAFGASDRGCWYNAVTAAVSHDGGRSFVRPPGASHLVGAVPYRFGERRIDLRSGLFAPSNMFQHQGHYYVTVFAEGQGEQRRGVCLLRTRTPERFSSWRAWDGAAFRRRLIDPYREAAATPGKHVCVPVSPSRIGHLFNSVVRHRPSGRFIALMTAVRRAPGQERKLSGVYASHSADLIDWSTPQLLLEAPIPWHMDCGRPFTIAYPALIDRDSSSPVFDDVDDSAELYLTRMNLDDDCRVGWDRDLLRLPVRLVFDHGGRGELSAPARTAGAAAPRQHTGPST